MQSIKEMILLHFPSFQIFGISGSLVCHLHLLHIDTYHGVMVHCNLISHSYISRMKCCHIFAFVLESYKLYKQKPCILCNNIHVYITCNVLFASVISAWCLQLFTLNVISDILYVTMYICWNWLHKKVSCL